MKKESKAELMALAHLAILSVVSIILASTDIIPEGKMKVAIASLLGFCIACTVVFGAFYVAKKTNE